MSVETVRGVTPPWDLGDVVEHPVTGIVKSLAAELFLLRRG